MEEKSDCNDFGRGLVAFPRQAGASVVHAADIHTELSRGYAENAPKVRPTSGEWDKWLADVRVQRSDWWETRERHTESHG